VAESGVEEAEEAVTCASSLPRTSTVGMAAHAAAAVAESSSGGAGSVVHTL